jgi:hypothetical protein
MGTARTAETAFKMRRYTDAFARRYLACALDVSRRAFGVIPVNLVGEFEQTLDTFAG